MPRNVQRATSCLRCRGIMSQCSLLSHGILKELGKLAELKQRGLILDRHFETIKAHVREGGQLRCEGAMGRHRERVGAEAERCLRRRRVGTARRKAVDRGKQARERAAKGTLGGNIWTRSRLAAEDRFRLSTEIERTRGGVKELISGISFPPPTPESRRSCPHCPMTFVNEQGLGIHVRTQHSSANMSNGVRLLRMLRKDVGGSVLPWEAAGPGRCWHVKFDHATGTASFRRLYGGLITHQSQKDTRHLYDYCVQLELDQSTRKMKLPLDKYSGDSDAAVGSWVLLEGISRSGRVRRTNVTLVDQEG
ncbi:unnamed protein product [Ectocarpus sp. CCAP 1310/34]|nr:unnamed protein product [Ectocarpus sp. CCAP 1310/34]